MAVIGIILVVGAASGEAGRPAARVESRIQGSDYFWTVTNMGASPITEFHIDIRNTYNHKAPPGWALEASETRFSARARGPEDGIGPRQRGEFSTRVTTVGAVPGQRAAAIVFADGARKQIGGVLAPAPESPLATFVAPIVLAALAGWLWWRGRMPSATPRRSGQD